MVVFNQFAFVFTQPVFGHEAAAFITEQQHIALLFENQIAAGPVRSEGNGIPVAPIQHRVVFSYRQGYNGLRNLSWERYRSQVLLFEEKHLGGYSFRCAMHGGIASAPQPLQRFFVPVGQAFVIAVLGEVILQVFDNRLDFSLAFRVVSTT